MYVLLSSIPTIYLYFKASIICTHVTIHIKYIDCVYRGQIQRERSESVEIVDFQVRSYSCVLCLYNVLESYIQMLLIQKLLLKFEIKIKFDLVRTSSQYISQSFNPLRLFTPGSLSKEDTSINAKRNFQFPGREGGYIAAVTDSLGTCNRAFLIWSLAFQN